MLMQFNCKNFKSYKEEFSLDMSATSITEHSDHVVLLNKGAVTEKLLKVAAIYGANASGKSNVLEALEHMKFLVKTSFTDASKRKIIPLKRFSFDEESKNSTSIFEVYFTYKEEQYQYGFSLNSNKIFEEWLYKRDFRMKEKYTLIFEREFQEYSLNDSLKDYLPLLNSLSPQTLLLSFLSNIKLPDINNVYDWFSETNIINFGDPLRDMMAHKILPQECFDEKEDKNEFEKYLNSIDVGIEKIKVEEIPDSKDEDGNAAYKVFSIHTNNETKQPESLNLSEESHGTLKMITLYEPIKNALRHGATLLIDEMDAKLHPLLTKYIVNIFFNKEINKKNAQLIFTTHDVVNLTKELFRRDEIWFVEKNEKKESSLYSLIEYRLDDTKVRKDASYNKDYLYGRYGAVPILKKFGMGGE